MMIYIHVSNKPLLMDLDSRVTTEKAGPSAKTERLVHILLRFIFVKGWRDVKYLPFTPCYQVRLVPLYSSSLAGTLHVEVVVVTLSLKAAKLGYENVPTSTAAIFCHQAPMKRSEIKQREEAERLFVPAQRGGKEATHDGTLHFGRLERYRIASNFVGALFLFGQVLLCAS